MTDEMRKLLTEYLGECWHEAGRNPHGNPRYVPICQKCKVDLEQLFGDYHRCFDLPVDMNDLRRKLAENKEFWGLDSFLDWADTKWDHESSFDELGYVIDDNFTNWLMDPERFCFLVAEWLKEKEG